MVSLITNAAAQTALKQLRAVNRAGETVRAEISTGLKVRKAGDNPAFFLVSSKTKGDVAVLNGLRDNLTVLEGSFKAATAGLRQLDAIVLQMADMIPVTQNGVAIDQLEVVFDDLLDQMRDVIDASGFQGSNLLTQKGATTSIIGLDRDGTGLGMQTLSLEGADMLRRTFDGLTENANQFVIDPGSSAFNFESKSGSDTANTTDPINSWELITAPGPLQGYVTWAQDSVGQDGYITQAQLDNFSPRMDYKVRVKNAGTYYINVRGFGTNGNSDSIHVGLDGVRLTDGGGVNLQVKSLTSTAPTQWAGRSTYGGVRVQTTIATPGIYTVNIWGREDGVYIDRLEFTDVAAVPAASYDPEVTALGGSSLPYFTNPIEGAQRRETAGLMELIETINPEAMQLNPDQAMLIVDAARAKINRYMSQVGAYEKQVVRQRQFLGDLTDGLDGSVAALIEADLAEASSRLQAVQVQEQLAIQSLGQASQRPSVLLSLYR
ncbi:flagellin [Parvularcula maris]|uniref:Flagellin n=1 Tax=Parvularcula maris TaxID=2965077 RepID=A0A9X2LA92_9PROT|nr:flagellin [Parvularcula maris]MCQ8185959.1 flagellin [Parvularcula maris]